jgi:hypothetical protein
MAAQSVGVLEYGEAGHSRFFSSSEPRTASA